MFWQCPCSGMGLRPTIYKFQSAPHERSPWGHGMGANGTSGTDPWTQRMTCSHMWDVT